MLSRPMEQQADCRPQAGGRAMKAMIVAWSWCYCRPVAWYTCAELIGWISVMDKQHGVTGICSSARTGREKLGASRDEEEHERRRASSGLCLSC